MVRAEVCLHFWLYKGLITLQIGILKVAYYTTRLLNQQAMDRLTMRQVLSG